MNSDTEHIAGRFQWRRAFVALISTCGVVHAPAWSAGLTKECLDAASARFGHSNPKILQALAAQESSGKCTLRHPTNADGSHDIGCLGINSSQLPALKRKFGITEQDLQDPCINAHVGAWIYAKKVRQFGDTWRAVGAYNAASEHKRIAYAWKIYTRIDAQR